MKVISPTYPFPVHPPSFISLKNLYIISFTHSSFCFIASPVISSSPAAFLIVSFLSALVTSSSVISASRYCFIGWFFLPGILLAVLQLFPFLFSFFLLLSASADIPFPIPPLLLFLPSPGFVPCRIVYLSTAPLFSEVPRIPFFTPPFPIFSANPPPFVPIFCFVSFSLSHTFLASPFFYDLSYFCCYLFYPFIFVVSPFSSIVLFSSLYWLLHILHFLA